jgi:hypothetical protein
MHHFGSLDLPTAAHNAVFVFLGIIIAGEERRFI